MLKNYLKTAFRNIWKTKGYSFLNIFGLAVGIACAGFIFLWVENELSFDQNNDKKDQLYQVLENQAYDGKTYTFSATPGLLGPVMKDEIPGIKNTCGLPGIIILYSALVTKPFMKPASMPIRPSSTCSPFILYRAKNNMHLTSCIPS